MLNPFLFYHFILLYLRRRQGTEVNRSGYSFTHIRAQGTVQLQQLTQSTFMKMERKNNEGFDDMVMVGLAIFRAVKSASS